jgi:hypothetical protein
MALNPAHPASFGPRIIEIAGEPFADDRIAFTFDAYFAAKHIPSQIALK